MEGYFRAGPAQEKQGGDHFIVEELLDFSGEENGGTEIAGEEDGRSEETGGNCSADSFSGGGGGDTRFSDELFRRSLADVGFLSDLCEPQEELAELEWLSNFVEDSFSSENFPKQNLTSSTKTPFSAAGAAAPPPVTGDPPVPAKARSKRARTAPRNWSSRLLLLSKTNTAALSPSPDGRKCLHCATDKTPQWRAGPMGPKTLCNACGVRFKSGRLVPEYRPAASPTFVLSKHSNSHRKVIELRRQKEILEQQFFTCL